MRSAVPDISWEHRLGCLGTMSTTSHAPCAFAALESVKQRPARLRCQAWLALNSADSRAAPGCRELEEQGRYQAVYIIEQLVHNMNCSHHLWVNKRAEHAYFVEHDFEVGATRVAGSS